MMPTSEAIARPEREMEAPKAVKEMPPMELKPSAQTRIRAAIIVFLLLVVYSVLYHVSDTYGGNHTV